MSAQIAIEIAAEAVEAVVVEVSVGAVAQRTEFAYLLKEDAVHAAAHVFVEQGRRCTVVLVVHVA